MFRNPKEYPQYKTGTGQERKQSKQNNGQKPPKNPYGRSQRPIGFERRLASVEEQKLEAHKLQTLARNYNPECLVACRRALENARRSAELFLACTQVDERFRKDFDESMRLGIEITLIFELRSKHTPSACQCGNVIPSEEFSIESITWGHLIDYI